MLLNSSVILHVLPIAVLLDQNRQFFQLQEWCKLYESCAVLSMVLTSQGKTSDTHKNTISFTVLKKFTSRR